MNDIQQATDQAITTVASKATYTGAATTGAGWALSNEFIALGGFVLAVLGYLTTLVFKVREDRRQLYFKRKEDERRQAEHEATMREIATRHTVVQDAVSKELTTRLSRAELGHYSGMPKPPQKPEPEPKPPLDEGEKQ